jgi:hypothetical protein
MTCRAIPARCKGHSRQGQGQDNIARGTKKEQTLGKRHCVQPKDSNGIRDRDIKEQLHLRKERTTGNSIRGQSRRQRLRLESAGNVN